MQLAEEKSSVSHLLLPAQVTICTGTLYGFACCCSAVWSLLEISHGNSSGMSAIWLFQKNVRLLNFPVAVYMICRIIFLFCLLRDIHGYLRISFGYLWDIFGESFTDRHGYLRISPDIFGYLSFFQPWLPDIYGYLRISLGYLSDIFWRSFRYLMVFLIFTDFVACIFSAINICL